MQISLKRQWLCPLDGEVCWVLQTGAVKKKTTHWGFQREAANWDIGETHWEDVHAYTGQSSLEGCMLLSPLIPMVEELHARLLTRKPTISSWAVGVRDIHQNKERKPSCSVLPPPHLLLTGHCASWQRRDMLLGREGWTGDKEGWIWS